ncbi:MAG: hypoxanthine phosphoribosyltransferase [Clostridia bacterium]|nr:MAG: hypoxanthine phosphoribosyltransferase [Clostridia bacterium]
MPNAGELRVLYTREAISGRVAELGRQITADYQGRSLCVVGILKGATIFLADLVRSISLPLTLDFMAVSSYGHATSSTGVVRILKDLDTHIAGHHVLIVEDIVDSGLTLRYLLNLLAARGPASLRTCVFLDKPARREVEVPLDYVGFAIPDVFVVGYGLDYAEDYRHLPYLAVIDGEKSRG